MGEAYKIKLTPEHELEIRELLKKERTGNITPGYNMKTLEERDREIERLWAEFGDAPMDPGTEKLEEAFFIFPAGTDREEVWKWFDARYSRGVAHLLYGDGVDRTDDVAEYVYRKGMCCDCESEDCAYNAHGECRYPLIGERKAKIDDDGCSDYVFTRN